MEERPLLILSGPSGIGKTFLIQHINALGFAPVLMTTTRSPRPTETNGVDYEFLSITKYRAETTRTDDFFMDNFFFGTYYGIRKSAIRSVYQAGNIPYLFIYIEVIEQIIKTYPNSYRIYLKPHDFCLIEKRLGNRDQDGISRIEKAREELLLFEQRYHHYYQKIVTVYDDNISSILRHLQEIYQI